MFSVIQLTQLLGNAGGSGVAVLLRKPPAPHTHRHISRPVFQWVKL